MHKRCKCRPPKNRLDDPRGGGLLNSTLLGHRLTRPNQKGEEPAFRTNKIAPLLSGLGDGQVRGWVVGSHYQGKGSGNVQKWYGQLVRINNCMTKSMPPPLAGYGPPWNVQPPKTSIKYVYVYRVVIKKAPAVVPASADSDFLRHPKDFDEVALSEYTSSAGEFALAGGWVPLKSFAKQSRTLIKKRMKRALKCHKCHGLDGLLDEESAVETGQVKLGSKTIALRESSIASKWKAMPQYKSMPRYRLDRATSKLFPPLQTSTYPADQNLTHAVDFDRFGWLAIKIDKNKKGHGKVHDYYPSPSDCRPDEVSSGGYIHLCHNVGNRGGIAKDTFPVSAFKARAVLREKKYIFAVVDLPQPSKQSFGPVQPSEGHAWAKKPASVDKEVKMARTVWKKVRRVEVYVLVAVTYHTGAREASRVGWVPVRALQFRAPKRIQRFLRENPQ